MICQACQHDNPARNAFCGGCGVPLAPLCPKCGESNPPANGFCGKCGERLAAETEAATAAPEPETGERRQLTVLFCDLVGSTDLAARLDPEEYGEALHTYHTRTDEVITRYGGYVAQHLGDGLLVYFAWPEAYDDAAERAVRAGLGLVEATATVQAGGAALAARVGLHTGTVVLSNVGVGVRHETLAVGDTPNVAARAQGAAKPGQVVITAATQRLVAGLFIVEEQGARPLKGVPQPVELYRVVQPSGVRGRLGAAAAHGFTPFVNRSEERAMLRSRFGRACDGEGQVVLLTGEAGIGKSRLAQVLREELADTPHTWLETGGSAHFANTPFHSVNELLKQRRPWEEEGHEARAEAMERSLRRAGVDPTEALPLLAPLLGLAVPDGYRLVVAAPEVARKRLLATLAAWLFGTARLQPLVILIEDLHWVDPSSLELLQLLVQQGATVPLLLLCTARPQFRVPWPSRAHYTQLTLGRLPKRHVRDMVLGVAAQATLLAEVIDEVAARTDGVPLFVEELTKAVVEAGATAVRHEIPSTLADSLMARLDRLGTSAKEVAQIGAVCGREFSFALLHAVHPIAEAELEAALRKLVDAELVHVQGLVPQATYTFKHALVQDAAYEAMLKSRRRALHAQVADALATQFLAVAGERPELLAHHRESAAQFEAALAAWQQAGERALGRGAHHEAEHYLERGLGLLVHLPEGPQREWQEFQLQLSLGQTRLFTQGFAAPAAGAAFERALYLGERLAEPVQMVPLLFGLFLSALMRNGPAVARPLADQLQTLAQRSGVGSFEAAGHLAAGMTDFHLGNPTAARAHFVAGIERHDTAPSPFATDLGAMLRTFLAEAYWHLGLADQARACAREACERAAQSPLAAERAATLIQSTVLCVFLRDPGQVAIYTRQALEACAEEPDPSHAALAKVMQGWSLAEQGEGTTGQALVRAGIETLLVAGQRFALELLHCLLADTCVLAGDLDGALRALAEGENACPDQCSDRANTLGRRAEILVQRAAPPVEIASVFADALACARRYESKSTELHIATSNARWLRQQGRSTEACDLLAPLYASFTEGFDTRDLVEARELLEELGVDDGAAELSARAVESVTGSER